MKFAVIDIGSNTAKAEIYKYKNNALKLKLKEVRRDLIADHKDGGSLDSDGVSILINIMKEFALICRQNEVEKIFPYATQSLRDIDNADEVLRMIRAATGFNVEIISGEEEARLCFDAFRCEHGALSGALSDMGGGSTEITLFDCGKVEKSESVPFGSRSLVHALGIDTIPDTEQEKKIRKMIDDYAEQYRLSCAKGSLYACGGTSSGMFRLLSEKAGGKVSSASVDTLYDFYAYCKSDIKKAAETALLLTSDRYDTVYTGLFAHICLCEAIGCRTVRLCKSTCRRGYAEKMIKNGYVK